MRASILIVLATACSNPDNPEQVDAPIAADAAVDSKAIDAPSAARHGFVTLAETNFVGGSPDSSLDIMFGEAPSPYGTPVAVDGPCTSYSIQGSPPPMRSAGTLTVTGTTTALTASPTGVAPSVHYQTTPALPTDLFAPAATISLTAAGSPDFAGFSGTVTAPAALAGFTPPATMSRAGSTVTWTAGTATMMYVVVIGGDNTNVGIVFCRVPDTGSYTIAASSFALLPAGTMGSLVLGRANQTAITTTSGDVTLEAISASGAQDVTLTP
jgi:hypothetical protein